MNNCTRDRYSQYQAKGFRLPQFLAAIVLGLALPSMAAGDEPLLLAEMKADQVHRLKETGDIMSLEALLRQVRQEYPGRVIEIELEEENGRYIYELEIVDDEGIVWDIELDARSGELIKREVDD